jgi:hypothetical protein
MIFVKLSPDALKALVSRAQSERRRPQDEAGLIIEEALGIRKRSIPGHADTTRIEPGRRK